MRKAERTKGTTAHLLWSSQLVVRSLIEQWFPAALVGAESLRERGAASALPPINFLHVWWARRPLTASRAAVLGSLLPAWPTDDEASADPSALRIQNQLQDEFPGGQTQYHAWFLRALGILGDPVKGRAAIKAAVAAGTKTKGNAYGYERAFTITPSAEVIRRIKRLTVGKDGTHQQVVLDLFAGGGSIPFETLRLGLSSIANELNPVAALVLQGTVTLPFRYGPALADDIRTYGSVWATTVEARLKDFYPDSNDGTKVASYIWVHTVPCPTTGYPTPLSPHYWVANNTERKVAVRLETDSSNGTTTTTIVEGPDAASYGNRSTYKQGTAISIWTNEPFDGEYIREQAQSGKMSEMLLAVVYSNGQPGRQFRPPSDADRKAVEAAKSELERRRPGWEIADVIPSEPIPTGYTTRQPHNVGIMKWSDMFTARQLLATSTMLEALREAGAAATRDLGVERGRAVALYLAFALDKAVNYNSRLCAWHPLRVSIANTFDRHDFSLKWSFGEFEAARSLPAWIMEQVLDAYMGITRLIDTHPAMFEHEGLAGTFETMLGSATAIQLADHSVDLIVTDPPYYDNVMYAESSDYFYVWLKRALRDTWPEYFHSMLTDKDLEIVANPYLFTDIATHKGSGKRVDGGKTAVELASEKYERLLTVAFRQADRVLKEGGVMTVMFTHKRVEAWDTLGMALIQAGFQILSSWPVHTESDTSLQQAKKNSASSTIMLTCRKRQSNEPAYWNDIRSDVERVVEESVARFAAEGIVGVDLTLATYGPALSVLSQKWPVYTGNSDPAGNPEVIRPDVALDLAREKVAGIKKRGLLGGREVDFDRETDWWLLAWNDFRAREFPSGEALKLSIATHLDLDDLVRRSRLLSANSGNASILTPAQRRASNAINPDATSFATYVDALHCAMLVYEEDGLTSTRAWLRRTGYAEDPKFHDVIAAAINAVPRMKAKGVYALPEAAVLENIRATLFENIKAPVEAPVQSELDLATV